MTVLADAISQVDTMISELSVGVPEEHLPRLRVDPDDPWAATINPPPCVHKVKCEKTGYLLTKPFERRCPMPEAFVPETSYLDGMLKPVMNASGVAPAGAGGADKKPAAGGPKGGEGKPVGGEGGQKKEKKEKKKPDAAAAPAGNEKLEAFGKSQLQIGEVIEVGLVENSDKLYLCKVQVAPDDVRQVVTGLQKHVPVDDLLHKKVVVITNLKVAKLAGQNSEAMIMATECADASATEGKIVKLVVAPQNAAVGERIYIEGGAPTDGCPKQLKTHFWETTKANLRVNGGKAMFDGVPIMCASGPITAAPGIPDGAEIK